MTLSSRDSSSSLDWKFSQVFGERCPGEDVQDVDIVSAIGFNKSGDYLAVGDQGGCVMIFERKDKKDSPNHPHSRYELEQLDYKTEFQSHEPEFDYLKSLEIEEKINRVRWCGAPTGSLLILSTNDKTIKLWKVKDHKMKKVKEIELHPFVRSENYLFAERSFMSGQGSLCFSSGYHQEWMEKMATISPFQDVQTKVTNTEDAAYTRCRKVYADAHDFNINSISDNRCSDKVAKQHGFQ